MTDATCTIHGAILGAHPLERPFRSIDTDSRRMYRAMPEEEGIAQKKGSTRRAEPDEEALFLRNPQR